MNTVFQPLKDYVAWTFGYVMSCGDYVEGLCHDD